MSGNAPLALLIDDEAPIRRLVTPALEAEGFRVQEAATGDEGLQLALKRPPDLVILDLGLPDLDGQTVLLRLREWFKGPIIILSARDLEAQKVTALDNGADDYLTKPFSTSELLARVRVALRHASRLDAEQNETITTGELKIDLGSRRVVVGQREIALTPIEFKVLTTLARHAGKVLTHRFLLNEVWGPNHQQENHNLRVFMASLRRKIEVDSAQPRYLLTEQGVGYRLASD